jgi:hypothetical protein
LILTTTHANEKTENTNVARYAMARAEVPRSKLAQMGMTSVAPLITIRYKGGVFARRQWEALLPYNFKMRLVTTYLHNRRTEGSITWDADVSFDHLYSTGFKVVVQSILCPSTDIIVDENVVLGPMDFRYNRTAERDIASGIGS